MYVLCRVVQFLFTSNAYIQYMLLIPLTCYHTTDTRGLSVHVHLQLTCMLRLAPTMPLYSIVLHVFSDFGSNEFHSPRAARIEAKKPEENSLKLETTPSKLSLVLRLNKLACLRNAIPPVFWPYFQYYCMFEVCRLRVPSPTLRAQCVGCSQTCA